MELPSIAVHNYNNAWHVCNARIEEMIMSVKRIGLSKILDDTFINNPSGIITPTVVIQKLATYPSVAQIMYNKTRSVKCHPSKFVNVTVIQCIASVFFRM